MSGRGGGGAGGGVLEFSEMRDYPKWGGGGVLAMGGA